MTSSSRQPTAAGSPTPAEAAHALAELRARRAQVVTAGLVGENRWALPLPLSVAVSFAEEAAMQLGDRRRRRTAKGALAALQLGWAFATPQPPVRPAIDVARERLEDEEDGERLPAEPGRGVARLLSLALTVGLVLGGKRIVSRLRASDRPHAWVAPRPTASSRPRSRSTARSSGSGSAHSPGSGTSSWSAARGCARARGCR